MVEKTVFFEKKEMECLERMEFCRQRRGAQRHLCFCVGYYCNICCGQSIILRCAENLRKIGFLFVYRIVYTHCSDNYRPKNGVPCGQKNGLQCGRQIFRKKSRKFQNYDSRSRIYGQFCIGGFS